MDMLRFPRGTRNEFLGVQKVSKNRILFWERRRWKWYLSQFTVHMVPKKSSEGFQDRKFSKFFGGSTSALGDYEVVYSVWWLGFYSVE